jgi:ketosteroid isomerase-like protein
MRAAVYAALISIALAGSAPAELADEDRAAIRVQFERATAPMAASPQDADWERFVDTHYAPDARLMPPNQPAVQGRDAILSYYRSIPQMTSFRATAEEINGDEDVAYVRGSYVIHVRAPNGGGTLGESGKYLQIWRKFGDTWRSTLEMFNADGPVTASGRGVLMNVPPAPGTGSVD